MTDDLQFMQAALALAERGRGAVEPNPLVGAVVVRDGKIVGRGWHRQYGGPHAEVHALADAGPAARGATVYVTLEPCCHHGKTPPCTDALIRAGVARVVAAMTDPFPSVSGGGVGQLMRAGIVTAVGIAEAEARRLNAPYLTLLGRRRPFVRAKWAMTLDGRTATAAGDSRWISGEPARRIVHDLRGRADAVLIGAGTLRADDPMLNARPPGSRTPTRIVVTRSGRLPIESRLFATPEAGPVIVATATPMTLPGVELLHLPTPHGSVDLPALFAELGRRRMTNVLVEGGAGLLGALFDADLIDEYLVFVSPILLGDGRPTLAGSAPPLIADARKVVRWQTEPVGDDILIRATVRPEFAGSTPRP